MSIKISITDISGGIEEFLNFLDNNKNDSRFTDDLNIDPQFRINDNTLGAELISIILSGINLTIPFIIYFLESNKQKNEKGTFSLKATFSKEGKEINIDSNNSSIQEIEKILKSF